MSTQDKNAKDLNKRLLELVHSISLAEDLPEALVILLQQVRSLITRSPGIHYN